MQEQLDRAPASEDEPAQTQGYQQADSEKTPEDGAADVRHLDGVGPGGSPGQRSSEGSVAHDVSAEVTVEVELVQEIVE